MTSHINIWNLSYKKWINTFLCTLIFETRESCLSKDPCTCARKGLYFASKPLDVIPSKSVIVPSSARALKNLGAARIIY